MPIILAMFCAAASFAAVSCTAASSSSSSSIAQRGTSSLASKARKLSELGTVGASPLKYFHDGVSRHIIASNDNGLEMIFDHRACHRRHFGVENKASIHGISRGVNGITSAYLSPVNYNSLMLLRGGGMNDDSNSLDSKKTETKKGNNNSVGWNDKQIFGAKKQKHSSDETCPINSAGDPSSDNGSNCNGPGIGGTLEITMNTKDRNIDIVLERDPPPSSTSDGYGNHKESKDSKEHLTPLDATNLLFDTTIKQLERDLANDDRSEKQKRKQGSKMAKLISGGATSSATTSMASNKMITNNSPRLSSQTAHLSAKFPISKEELPHFFSMSFLMFLFIYVFTTVRDTKDTLVVSNCGAESIPFLKLYAVMPCAAAFIVSYSKLSNMLGKQTLFYVTLIPFFIFYGIFAFVLFPNRDKIHFPVLEGVDGANTALSSSSLSAAVNLLRYWSFSLYFVISELWASAGVPLLFWQCANDVTPMSQAKRFYPLFAITGNLAPIVSGKVMSYVISLQKTNNDTGFGSTLKTLAIIKGVVCLGIITIYRRVYAMAEDRQKKERMEQSLSTIRGIQKTGKVEITMKFEKKKEKLTLKQSAQELMKSKELKAMGTMVLCYNVCIELTEVLWKAILRKTYPSKSLYMAYMARFSQTVGVVAFLLQLIASEIINLCGWRWTAMIPPVTMGILAVAFFAAVIAGEDNIPLAQALLIGTVQNVANKVTKYSLFDPCKEMAYIPLGPDAKVKGKAAVDVLGARMGRSIGSASQQLLVSFVGNGSIMDCAPYLGVLYVYAITVWSSAVSVLGQLFETSSPSSSTEKTKGSGGNRSPKLETIGEAITIIKNIEDAKKERKNAKNTTSKDDSNKGKKSNT